MNKMLNGEVVEMTPEEEAGFLAEQAALAPTLDDRGKELQRLVQEHMDAAAQALGYDDLKTAVGYAEEPAVPRFQAEGRALRAWRSLVWARCHWYFEEVKAGRALEPTFDALLAILPKLELPE